MNLHHEFGRLGEEKAALYLKEKGYVILERNWRLGRKEVDIICSDGEKIIIVEVKSREKGADYPEELLDISKRRNLLKAGAAYLRRKHLEKELRFDLVMILGKDFEVIHIQDAIKIFD